MTDKNVVLPPFSAREQADEIERLRTENAELRTENAELRADAERYRWIRDPCSGAERVIYYSRGDYGKGLMSGPLLDAAIDAAMKEQK